MKKLTLTLFLALASLVSFGQSTVQTIRLADADIAKLSVGIPEGTMVVDVATKKLYLAIDAVPLNKTITTGLSGATPLFLLINGYVYSVTDELEADEDQDIANEIKLALNNVVDGEAVEIANTDFKVYVNGDLLRHAAYSYEAEAAGNGEIVITGVIYQYDQVSVVYNTIK